MTLQVVSQLVLFLAGSGCLLYLSRASLRAPRSHGFYRFFAWESILALFLLNVTAWFRDPFSPARQPAGRSTDHLQHDQPLGKDRRWV